MKQGRASRDVAEGRANIPQTHPRTHAIVPAGVAQLGQRQGNHSTNQGSTQYGGVDMYGGKGYEPPIGPSVQSGVGGGRDCHRSGSQGRR